MLRKSKNLLLFLASIISIVCSGQKDSIVCLTNRQADFFILQHLDAQYLRIDTTKKADQIVILSELLSNKRFEAENINLKFKNKASELLDLNKVNVNLTEKTAKCERKLRLFKNTTLIFGSISVILIGILLLKS